MKINIHAPFQLSQYNVNLIHLRVEKLAKYYDRIIMTDVFLNNKIAARGADNWEVEIKIKVPRKVLVAKGNADSFERALPVAVEKMRKQIEKTKTMNI